MGTLKAAKKRGIIMFEGQLLLKGSHDKVIVSLACQTLNPQSSKRLTLNPLLSECSTLKPQVPIMVLKEDWAVGQ